MRKFTPFLFLGIVLIFLCIGCQEKKIEWQPAESPLFTKWAKDVSPDNVWPEYPRPQMVREEWLNLNGLWDYTIVGKDTVS